MKILFYSLLVLTRHFQVDETLAVKVADFGESRTAETNMTIATGTYNWMAPEVLTSRNYTAKADVFSFGIILWELLMNRLPDRSLDDVKVCLKNKCK